MEIEWKIKMNVWKLQPKQKFALSSKSTKITNNINILSLVRLETIL